MSAFYVVLAYCEDSDTYYVVECGSYGRCKSFLDCHPNYARYSYSIERR